MKTNGFTLVELMTVTALLTVFATAAITLTTTLFGGQRAAQSYADDLLGCQDALRWFERDVRAARDVAFGPEGTDFVGTEEPVEYRLENATLTRTQGPDHRILARNIARFDVRRDGALVGVELQIGTRNREATRRPAIVKTRVRMRAGEGVR